jgi:hypothetical protein
MKHELKIGVNKYGPGIFNHQIDICDMAAGLGVPVLNLFFPKRVVDAVLHICPYKKVTPGSSVFNRICVVQFFFDFPRRKRQ